MEGIKRIAAGCCEGECLVAPTVETMKSAAWLLAVEVPAHAVGVETRIAAIERVPCPGRGRPAQFIPIRFAWPNKLGRHEKLLLAFDALALSETLGQEVSLGKIIHGDDTPRSKVKVNITESRLTGMGVRFSRVRIHGGRWLPGPDRNANFREANRPARGRNAA